MEIEVTLKINDKNGFTNLDIDRLFYYLFSFKGRDSLFERDGYSFIINNCIWI